jgi:hypothetical protein
MIVVGYMMARKGGQCLLFYIQTTVTRRYLWTVQILPDTESEHIAPGGSSVYPLLSWPDIYTSQVLFSKTPVIHLSCTYNFSLFFVL